MEQEEIKNNIIKNVEENSKREFKIKTLLKKEFKNLHTGRDLQLIYDGAFALMRMIDKKQI